MTTQSKSVLMPFLIIAGIVFAVALAWKLFANQETEVTAKATEVETSTAVKAETSEVKIKAKTEAPKIVVYDEPAFLEPTIENREELRNQAKSNMKFAMRYPTLDKAISALESFRNNGNDEAATQLISYIRTSFPNDNIPTNLLD